jgi:hypothetical protein
MQKILLACLFICLQFQSFSRNKLKSAGTAGTIQSGYNQFDSKVKFTAFTGTLISNGSQVQLHWTTDGEQYVRQYEVEWSSNGITWQALTVIVSRGGVNGFGDYTYSHTLLEGMNYYRIKLVEETDITTCSVLLCYRLKEKKSGIQLTPNPSLLYYRVALPENSPARTIVYNHFGSPVINLTTHTDQFELSVGSLPSGIYTVRIMQGTELFTRRFVRP